MRKSTVACIVRYPTARAANLVCFLLLDPTHPPEAAMVFQNLVDSALGLKRPLVNSLEITVSKGVVIELIT